MINKIWPKIIRGKYELIESEGHGLLDVNRINIFIGANNSGKSLFLRQLFEQGVEGLLYELEGDCISLNYELDVLVEGLGGGSINGVSGEELKRVVDEKDWYAHKQRETLIGYGQSLKVFCENNFRSNRNTGGNAEARLAKVLRKYDNEVGGIPLQSLKKMGEYTPFYIPVLRGMRPLDKDVFSDYPASGDPVARYAIRTKYDYFRDCGQVEERLYTGERLYQHLTEMLLGMPHERQIVVDYQFLLSEWFFDGQEVTLIPRHDHDVVEILIGQEEQRPIYDLGDGLQQIIIITSCAFFNKEPTYIFMEEPEVNLHPGLLRQLTIFLVEKTQHKYFFTTHSNTLLDLSLERCDVNIYKIEKSREQGETSFTITPAVGDRSVLPLLGVKPSSLYFSNCTVWVEGITDRLYLRAFIRIYLKDLEINSKSEYDCFRKYIENIHYSFVEYQGAVVEHWEFGEDEESKEKMHACCTASKPFVIADGDIEGKGDRQERLESTLGKNIYVLSCKEFENMLPVGLVVDVCKHLWAKFRRPKFDKELVELSDLKYVDYSESSEGLGFHIDRHLGLLGKGQEAEKIFAHKSGTLKDKIEFCSKAIELLDTGDYEITPELLVLLDRMFSHIQENNF